MSELSDILKEEYIKAIQQLDINTLLGMIEGAVAAPKEQSVNEETSLPSGDDQETLEMILKIFANAWKTGSHGDAVFLQY